jgi:hypothetical protein
LGTIALTAVFEASRVRAGARNKQANGVRNAIRVAATGGFARTAVALSEKSSTVHHTDRSRRC